MNSHAECLRDTIARLLDEAAELKALAAAAETTTAQAFELGRYTAFTHSLHTWKNQLETFGVGETLGSVWISLNQFLTECGLP